MRTIEPARLLRLAFGLDAAGTAAVAAAQLLALDRLTVHLNLPQVLLLESGVFMAAYAALLLVLMRARRLPAGLVLFIAIGNLGWAAGCAATALALAPGAWGVGWLAFQAAAVVLFSALQFAGLKASGPASEPGPSSHRRQPPPAAAP